MGGKRERDIRLAMLPDEFRQGAGDPQATVLMMYEQLEGYAIAIREWYLADKRSKRRYSRLLRGLAIILAVVGGLAPLSPLANQMSYARWGYVFLALAAACVAFDRIFGLSSAWMRDIAGAQAAEQVRSELYSGWAAITTAHDGEEERLERQLALLNRISAVLGHILDSETSEWRREFESSMEHLKSMVNRSEDSGDAAAQRHQRVT
jgi:hypothetical protein